MWFLLALFAGFLFAANRLLVRSVFLKGINPIAFLAIHNVISGALLLPIALIHPTVPQSIDVWGVVGLAVLAFFLGDLFAFLSLERIEASLYQILGQVRHVIVLFGGFLLFGEIISVSKIISILLLMSGVTVALVERSRIKITKGITYGILSPVFISLGFLAIKQISDDVSPALSASLILLATSLLAYVFLILKGQRPDKLVPTKKRKTLVLAAAIFSVFELVLFTALELGETSKVAPVAQSSLLFTLVGGYLFLHEQERLVQKVIGSLLIIVGISLLFIY